jgi:hypothetical protein
MLLTILVKNKCCYGSLDIRYSSVGEGETLNFLVLIRNNIS